MRVRTEARNWGEENRRPESEELYILANKLSAVSQHILDESLSPTTQSDSSHIFEGAEETQAAPSL